MWVKALIWGLLCSTSLLAPATSTTIFFDAEGPEEGVTEVGVQSFSYAGTTWFQGAVAEIVTAPGPEFVASGNAAYQIFSTDLGAFLTFDEPVDSARFFYVHDGVQVLHGHAEVRDADGGKLAFIESRVATVFGAPANLIVFNPPNPIPQIDFQGGIVDNFTFTTLTEPAPVPTVSEWGAPTMMLLVLTAGTVLIVGPTRHVRQITHDRCASPTDGLAVD